MIEILIDFSYKRKQYKKGKMLKVNPFSSIETDVLVTSGNIKVIEEVTDVADENELPVGNKVPTKTQKRTQKAK